MPEKALAFYVEALPQARAGTDLNLEAVVLDNLGVLHLHSGNWDKALTYFNQALPLRRALGNRRGEALSLDNIGSVYLGLRQPEKALEYDAQALPLLEAVGDRYKQAVVLGNMGHAYGQLGELAQSLAYHTRASALFEAAGDRLERSKSLNSIAVVQRNQGRFGDARASSEKALELLQFVRAHAGNAEERTAFVAAMSDHFDVYIDLLMRMHAADPAAGHDLEALEASEQARARTLQELLAESYADIRQGVDASLLKQESDLGQGVTAALDTLTKLLARAHTDEQKLAAEKDIAALTDRYRQAQAQIRSASPRYAA